MNRVRICTSGLAARPFWRVAIGGLRRIWPLLLFAWCGWQTYQRIATLVKYDYPMGIDGTIYYRGVLAWLGGGNPWDAAVVVNGFPYHYAGSPVTTMLMAPAALLSENAFTVVWLVLTWAAALWVLRRLHLPL